MRLFPFPRPQSVHFTDAFFPERTYPMVLGIDGLLSLPLIPLRTLPSILFCSFTSSLSSPSFRFLLGPSHDRRRKERDRNFTTTQLSASSTRVQNCTRVNKYRSAVRSFLSYCLFRHSDENVIRENLRVLYSYYKT